jgi:hypothetical protein
VELVVKKDGLQRILDFLDFLRSKGIEFRIDQQAPDELMVTFALVGARVEVTFDVEMMHFCVFKGSEAVETDEKILHDIIKEHWR